MDSDSAAPPTELNEVAGAKEEVERPQENVVASFEVIGHAMQPLTVEAVRAELASFACGALRRELNQGLHEELAGLREELSALGGSAALDPSQRSRCAAALPAPLDATIGAIGIQLGSTTYTEVAPVLAAAVAPSPRPRPEHIDPLLGILPAILLEPPTPTRSPDSPRHAGSPPSFPASPTRKAAHLPSFTCTEELQFLAEQSVSPSKRAGWPGSPRKGKDRRKEPMSPKEDAKKVVGILPASEPTIGAQALQHSGQTRTDGWLNIQEASSDGQRVHCEAQSAKGPELETLRRAGRARSCCCSCGLDVYTLVMSPAFGTLAGAAIFLNSALIGVQTEYASQHVGSAEPVIFEVCEWLFCVIFSLEIAFRICAYKMQFFCSAAKWWNFLDLSLVLLQLCDLGLRLLAAAAPTSAASAQGAGGGYSSMRLLRVLRLVRIVRLVRVLRLIGELRMMVVCILNSLKSLIWTVALLLLVIYVTAVYLTQMVLDHRILQHLRPGADESAPHNDLVAYFGSIFRSILTLYQAMSGGISWNDAVLPLMSEITPAMGLLFSLFVAFAILAIMNVVTAVFVESALQSAKRDTDVYIVHNVHDAFMEANIDMDTCVSFQEFLNLLETPQLRETLKTIDIDQVGAQELFHLLDTDFEGRVCVRDIVDTCIKSHGPAKAIDLITLMSEHRRQARCWSQQLQQMELNLQTCLSADGGAPANHGF